VYCTPGRAKKIVISLAIVALIYTASVNLILHFTDGRINELLDIFAVMYVVLPSSVLVVNLRIVCEVSRTVYKIIKPLNMIHYMYL